MSYEPNDKEPLIFEEPDLSGEYTASDYLRWRFEGYVELIKGKIFKMSPAPADPHQALSGELSFLFYGYLKGHICSLRTAPYDVYLVKEGEGFKQTRNIVQPDMAIICDKQKITYRGCVGSPDFVLEILSPSTRKKDLTLKMDLYEEYGVKEYWVVSIPERLFIINRLDANGKYANQKTYTEGAVIAPKDFPQLKVDITNLFIEAGIKDVDDF